MLTEDTIAYFDEMCEANQVTDKAKKIGKLGFQKGINLIAFFADNKELLFRNYKQK